MNQVHLIRRLIEEHDRVVLLKNYITLNDARNQNVDGLLWFKLALPEMLHECAYVYLMSRKPKAIYVTIEGVPLLSPHIDDNLKRLEIIANSKFTMECLTSVGMCVIDVAYHGIDYALCSKIYKKKEMLKRTLHSKFKEKCILLVNARNDPRKGLPFLLKALDIVNTTHRGKFKLILHTDNPPPEFQKREYVVILSKFGTLNYIDVLKLMASVDYLVFPSFCEGFGLPVLEANAVGTPAIHAWFPPLSEFSSKDFNFVFPYMERRLVKPQSGQYWVFHIYDPEHLAEMIKFAIDTYFEKREEYEEYCVKAYEHAKRWDYHITYMPLLRKLHIKPKKWEYEPTD